MGIGRPSPSSWVCQLCGFRSPGIMIQCGGCGRVPDGRGQAVTGERVPSLGHPDSYSGKIYEESCNHPITNSPFRFSPQTGDKETYQEGEESNDKDDGDEQKVRRPETRVWEADTERSDEEKRIRKQTEEHPMIATHDRFKSSPVGTTGKTVLIKPGTPMSHDTPRFLADITRRNDTTSLRSLERRNSKHRLVTGESELPGLWMCPKCGSPNLNGAIVSGCPVCGYGGYSRYSSVPDQDVWGQRDQSKNRQKNEPLMIDHDAVLDQPERPTGTSSETGNKSDMPGSSIPSGDKQWSTAFDDFDAMMQMDDNIRRRLHIAPQPWKTQDASSLDGYSVDTDSDDPATSHFSDEENSKDHVQGDSEEHTTTRALTPNSTTAHISAVHHTRMREYRRQEELEVAEALAREENVRQVRFELERPKARALERAENIFSAKEKKRPDARERNRRHIELIRAPEPIKASRKEKSYPLIRRPSTSRKNSVTMTLTQLDEQRWVLAAEFDRMQDESQATEVREREERNATLMQPLHKLKTRSGRPESLYLTPTGTRPAPQGRPLLSARVRDLAEDERQVFPAVITLPGQLPAQINSKEEEHALPKLDIPDNNHTRQYFEENDDVISVVSFANSIASVFSSNTASSSATGASSVSGYSSSDIATASKELISIFHANEFMLSLYKIALASHAIGPERLQRNLRRLFKVYSDHLKVEATDQLEYLAAQLVAMRSRVLAESIVEKFRSGTVRSRTIERGERSDSSEEDGDPCPVNEETLTDLTQFRRFLVESRAFKTLQAQLQAFIAPSPSKPGYRHSSNDKNTQLPNENDARSVKLPVRENIRPATWQLWRRDAAEIAYTYLHNPNGLPKTTLLLHLLVDFVFLATDVILINAGLLEPPLHSTKIRLRWSSVGKQMIFSDVEELEEGGVAELIYRIKHSSGVEVTSSPYRQYAGNQQYTTPRPDHWLKNGISKVTSAFTNSSKPSPCLPQHTPLSGPVVSMVSAQTPSQQQILHLVACMHRDPVRKFVQQDRIEDITTDQELLDFMRRRHIRQRSAFFRILSLKCVTGIYFAKLWLPAGGSVIVRHHGHCSDPCECMPPPAKVEPSATAEYRFSPIAPKTRPPIPPEYLADHFYNPLNAGKGDFWILNQFPKRTCGQLQGMLGQPAEGWGIYYHEVWDKDLITLVLFITLSLATLLFGILWAKYEFDVQGAFGISAWMAALGGMLLFVVVPRLEKVG